jgi:hypothetical protein
MIARHDLADGTALFAGRGGERWLFDAKRSELVAASRLAPEDLIAILPLDGARWLFVGQSGTSYEAREPLGAFVRSSAPYEPLAKVAAAAGTIVGVSRDGKLVHSDDAGASWRSVGPKDRRFVDVELSPDGSGLALSIPERFYQSVDFGMHWAELLVDAVGAMSLKRELEPPAISVRGVFGDYRFNRQNKKLEQGRIEAAPALAKLGAEPARGPDAEAIAAGRAVLVGDRYLEVQRDEKGRWRLWQGKLDTRLESRRLAIAESCQLVKITAFDDWVYLACMQNSAEQPPFTFYRSSDGAKSFVREDYVARGNAQKLALAAGAAGALLVTGICAPYADQRGCTPHGVYYRRQRKPTRTNAKRSAASAPSRGFELHPAATPALRDAAEAVAFSVDGNVAYAVGRRTKDVAYALFVARDRGHSFTARPIDPLSAAGGDESIDDLDIGRGAGPETAQIEALSAAEDGTLAIVAKEFSGPLLLVADDEGRIVSAARPPEERSLIAAAGSRAIAIGVESGEVFESLDGGSTWYTVDRLAARVCAESGPCDVPIRCAPMGCVVGRQLSRIGWRGQAGEDWAVLSPPEDAQGAVFERRIRLPIACTLQEGAWQPLAHVMKLPAADDAALGKAVWYAVAADFERAAVYGLRGHGGSRPHVEQVSLLAPVQQPHEYAMHVSESQIEGAAAVRYRALESGHGARLRGLEVAWDNLLEGRVGHGRLEDAGPYAPGDYEKGPQRVQQAHPDLVSIGEGGLYLRLHKAAADRQTTLFFDGQRTLEIPPVAWPATSIQSPRSEMAHIGTDHIAMLMLGPGAVVARARRESNQWLFDAHAIGIFDPVRFELEQHLGISYVGGEAALHLHSQSVDGSSAQAWLFRLRAKGAVVDPPLAAPTQHDLGQRPRHCSPEERQNSPRVVVPYQAGTRHPVLVVDPVEPERVLVTGEAVLHGTPDSACVAAFEAAPIPTDARVDERVRAILPFDDLEHAWLFRSGGSLGPQVEYRLMSCRTDPALEVPSEVYRAPGTRVKLPLTRPQKPR